MGDNQTAIPPWLVIARKEIGIHETAGRSHNPRIVEYHQSTTLEASDDETPWCSAFVNWCLNRAGLEGTNSAAAKSWLKWKGGRRVDNPKPGDIVVLNCGKPWQGHVTFFQMFHDDGLYGLGGNQSDQVKVSFYKLHRVAAYIRPYGY